MAKFFIGKIQSMILVVLLFAIVLSVPASSLAAIQGKGIMNSIPTLTNNLGNINGGISISQGQPMALSIDKPAGTRIGFNNASDIGGYLGDTAASKTSAGNATNKTSAGNATNKTSSGNATNQTATNKTTPIPPPSGIAMSYPDYNFKADSAQVSNMSLLDRMWRNSHFFCSMGRAYEGDTSYPDWILPTEYTKSAIAMNNWYDVNAAALNYTLPGTHLTPRYWSLFDFPY